MYNTTLLSCIIWPRGNMNTWNNSGPRMEPWGTPACQIMLRLSPLPLKYDPIQMRFVPDNPTHLFCLYCPQYQRSSSTETESVFIQMSFNTFISGTGRKISKSLAYPDSLTERGTHFIQDTSDFIHKICGNPRNNEDAMQWKARKLLYIIIKIIIVISRFPLLYVNCLQDYRTYWYLAQSRSLT